MTITRADIYAAIKETVTDPEQADAIVYGEVVRLLGPTPEHARLTHAQVLRVIGELARAVAYHAEATAYAWSYMGICVQCHARCDAAVAAATGAED